VIARLLFRMGIEGSIFNVHQRRFLEEESFECKPCITLPAKHRDVSLSLGRDSNPGEAAQMRLRIPLESRPAMPARAE